MLSRRALLAAPALAGVWPAAWALPPTTLRFPRDAGSHNDFATEWWYLTGYAHVAGQAAALGFQVTFFRSRVASTQAMPSRLAAKQLLFAARRDGISWVAATRLRKNVTWKPKAAVWPATLA